MAEKQKKFEVQISEIRTELVKLIDDSRVSVGQGMVIEKYASFSLNVSQLKYGEVMEIVAKIRPHGFSYQSYTGGQRYILITKSLYPKVEDGV